MLILLTFSIGRTHGYVFADRLREFGNILLRNFSNISFFQIEFSIFCLSFYFIYYPYFRQPQQQKQVRELKVEDALLYLDQVCNSFAPFVVIYFLVSHMLIFRAYIDR